MMLLGYVVLVRWFGGGGTISFASPSDAWVCSTGLVVWWWCYCIFLLLLDTAWVYNTSSVVWW